MVEIIEYKTGGLKITLSSSDFNKLIKILYQNEIEILNLQKSNSKITERRIS